MSADPGHWMLDCEFNLGAWDTLHRFDVVRLATVDLDWHQAAGSIFAVYDAAMLVNLYCEPLAADPESPEFPCRRVYDT